VILRDRIGDFLEKNRFSSTRRGDDDAALSLSDGGKDVDDAHGEIAVFRFKTKASVRIARTQIVEWDSRFRELGVESVHVLDFQQGQIFLPCLWRAHLAANQITGEEPESFYLRGRDVDVVGSSEIAVILAAQESVSLGKNLEHTLTVQRDIGVEQVLFDAEYELRLADYCGAGNLETVCHVLQLVNGFTLELSDVHGEKGLRAVGSAVRRNGGKYGGRARLPYKGEANGDRKREQA